MSSARQLLDQKLARRADACKLRRDQFHVEPGFNVAETPEEFAARVRGMVDHIKRGGTLPPIEVRSRDAGGVFIVDGHARIAAYDAALADGVPLGDPKDGEMYIAVVWFVGNDADRVARLLTSAEGRRLTPLQQSEIYKRLAAYGFPPADIAAKVGKTPEHVRQLLTLAEAPVAVQKLVREGKVAAAAAVKVSRKHGDRAAEVLGEQVTQAEAQGKKRVTARSVGPARVQIDHALGVVLAAALAEAGELLARLHAEYPGIASALSLRDRLAPDLTGCAGLVREAMGEKGAACST